MYEQLRPGAAASLARAMGEVGPLTDIDIERYLPYLPGVNDTDEEVALKRQLVANIIGANKQGIYGGNSFPDEQMDTSGGLANYYQ